MTTKKKFRWTLDLQLFAEPDENGLIDMDDGEDLTDLDYDFDNQHGPEYGDDDDDDSQQTEPQEQDEPSKQEEPKQENTEPESEPEPPKKKVQTPEENARFAEQRRQRQLQAEIERLKAESPEFKLAQRLSELYGVTPDVLLQQIEQEVVRKEAERRGVPPEIIQAEREREQRIKQLESQLLVMQFENWKSRVDAEGERLKKELPYLSDDDIVAAKEYLLKTGNLNGSLEEAVYALHGKKIAEAIREAARQEALAEISGRKSGPAVMSGRQPNQSVVLTPEERYVAKMMGLTEDEYIKYKT